MKKIVVIREVSSPLHILFPLFRIPLLIYYCHSSHTIFETLSQGHCTIIICHSTIVIKHFEKWLWNSSLLGKVAGYRTIMSLKWIPSQVFFKFFDHKCRKATAQYISWTAIWILNFKNCSKLIAKCWQHVRLIYYPKPRSKSHPWINV